MSSEHGIFYVGQWVLTHNIHTAQFCRFYLSGLCPHDLFSNTKSDLGPCDKEHNDKMKEMYVLLIRQDHCSTAHNFSVFA